MKHATIIVRAEWDDEAAVWVATSDDICGLAVEAETADELQKKALGVILDLLELNEQEFDLPDIPVYFMASQVSLIRNPNLG